jgi:hypothetical protein
MNGESGGDQIPWKMKGKIGQPLDSHFTKNITLQNQTTQKYLLFVKWRVGKLSGHSILSYCQMDV